MDPLPSPELTKKRNITILGSSYDLTQITLWSRSRVLSSNYKYSVSISCWVLCSEGYSSSLYLGTECSAHTHLHGVFGLLLLPRCCRRQFLWRLASVYRTLSFGRLHSSYWTTLSLTGTLSTECDIADKLAEQKQDSNRLVSASIPLKEVTVQIVQSGFVYITS